MDIRIDPHTLERAMERGANEIEIKDVLTSGAVIPAKHNRLAKAKVYPYNKERLGKQYAEKRIEVMYVIEEETIVTVTVYVFYGKWGK